jgi:hypothetical protein
MINRRRSGARGTPAKVNATAGLEASEGVNSASVSDGSHESVYLCPFYVTPPHWNSVVGFSNVREQIEAADKGDLVHITGRMRETSHGEGNEIAYRTELIADTFSVLAKAGGEQ